jgi:LacI family transcriptional regulator
MAKSKVTLHDVSRLADVSTATVSYVINRSRPVTEATRQKVLDAVKTLGYVPDMRARSLKSTHIQILALLFPFSEDTLSTSRYFRDIVATVCATAATLEYKVIISLLSREKSIDEQINEIRLSGLAGGLLLAGPSQEEVEILTNILDDFPAMLISASSSGKSISYIDVDNRQGMHRAVDYLVRLGHRRIAYVTPDEPDSHAVQRLSAYKEAMELYNLERLVYDLPVKADTEQGLRTMFENQPSAVIAFDDYRALQVHGFLTRRGIRIPEQISLIGFDDEDFGLHMSPSLTTVPQPFADMGALAVQKLVERVEDPNLPSFQKVFPLQILKRESCLAYQDNKHS